MDLARILAKNLPIVSSHVRLEQYDICCLPHTTIKRGNRCVHLYSARVASPAVPTKRGYYPSFYRGLREISWGMAALLTEHTDY